MHTHETLLRDECAYTGPIPWWDEAKDADAGAMFQSSMWTPEAFGSPVAGCVVDGAFANITELIGPLLENTDYCFWRSFDESQPQYCTSEAVQSCMQYNDYYSMFNCLVVYPTGFHVAGHASVGGMVSHFFCFVSSYLSNFADDSRWPILTAQPAIQLSSSITTISIVCGGSGSKLMPLRVCMT